MARKRKMKSVNDQIHHNQDYNMLRDEDVEQFSPPVIDDVGEGIQILVEQDVRPLLFGTWGTLERLYPDPDQT
jgi:hypothetical protein